MFQRRMIPRLTRQWLALGMLGLVWASSTDAAEQRCNELGTNCVCSEPFQMTSFTKSVDPAFWNPTDSTTKECGYEAAGHPISRVQQDVRPQSDATALSRLPAGHSISRFVSGGAGMHGIFFIGGDVNTAALGATFNARMAVRGYVYHSPDYNFRDDTPACHSKFLQGQPGAWHWENFVGSIHQYQFGGANFGPSSAFPRDCCWGAPGAALELTKNDWRGHWFRFEDVVTNRSGAGARHILYMKDVTRGVPQLNGGAEFVAADWYGTGTGPDNWDSSFNKIITSNPRLLPVAVNFYREISAGGGCNGWRGLSHLMIAGWDTNAGQRIGPAAEIEGGSGGGGDGTPPPPPTGLRLSLLQSDLKARN